MKNSWGFCALFLIFAAGATPAFADIDQLCLKQCVAKGCGSANCLTQCTYEVPAATSVHKAPASDLSPHRVLDAPVPSEGAIVLTHKPVTVSPNKDYACLNQCLHNGSAYPLCETRCTKVACPSGAVLCQRSLH